MKIFEIITTLGSGGAERFVVDLCNELAKKNDVTLIILYNIEEFGFFAHALSNRVKIISMNKKSGIDFKLFHQLNSLINKENPDIVHTHLTGIIYTLLGYLKSSRTKFIHTVHNDAAVEAEGLVSRTIRKFAFKSHKVKAITISEESQQSFTDFYNTQSIMIYNGSPSYKISNQEQYEIAKKELTKLKQNPQSVLLVNIARIQQQKNQITLAKAIESLNKKGYNIDLAIIGAPNDKQIVCDINSLKSPFIHLLGTRANPRDYMHAADAFCLSSNIEGMPITLIECFSVGTIPICTPVGGIKNMIKDSVNGLLSTGTSQDEIENALIRFINMSSKEREQMKQKSLASFEPYDITTCCHKYELLMQSLISKN